MQNAPSAKELVEAVRAFLEDTAMPNLEGHAAFHARVAANALATVERELTLGPKAAEDERMRLEGLLGADGSLEELSRLLAQFIRKGAMTLETPGLREHLWRTTIDKVSIDQPSYSGLQAALKARD